MTKYYIQTMNLSIFRFYDKLRTFLSVELSRYLLFPAAMFIINVVLNNDISKEHVGFYHVHN